jgi:Integral membrane protein possibly involved in chromosome condensation
VDSTASSMSVDQPGPAEPALPVRRWSVLGAVATGGIVGALARFGVQQAFPFAPDKFPWATFAVNTTGCLLIGVLMVLIAEVWTGRPLLRPFLGVGVLGGFTTFSAYALDVERAVSAGAARTALLYLGGTLVAALLAVWAGAGLTDAAIRTVRRRPPVRNGAARGTDDPHGGSR